MKAIVILGLFLAAAPAVLAAEDPLRAAKDLYASASYEEALTTLAGIEPSAAEIAQVDMYRAFSLYALGRTAEAEAVAESLIRREPLVDLDEAAPRIEAMFLNVRKRLLPVLIRAEYRTARTDLDEKRPESAKAHLIGARQLLARAQTIGAWDEGLADLQVLVDGFLDLTRAAADQASPAAPAAAVNTAVSEPAPQMGSLLPVQRATAPTIYGPEDKGVTPPSIVDQRPPRLPEQIRRMLKGSANTGVFDLIIDETGAVQQATVRTSIHQVYDELVIVASRSWRYMPATRNGVPVRYGKSIQITLN